MKIHQILPHMAAEFLGTFFLVLIGCGSMILAAQDIGFSSSLICLAFGGTISVMIYAVGHISGAHFNPAVTIAFFMIGKLTLNRVAPYLMAQFSGALLASLLHLLLWPDSATYGETLLSVNLMAGFGVEFILSFLLMFVITSVATDSRAIGELAGLAIGTTVALCAMVGGPLTNASMNPARSLAPAIISGNFQDLWVYFVATILGAICAAKVYEFIKCEKEGGENSCC